ncbi:MAG: DUF4157 domain-containing protein [Gammaproteobacteria bacterium]|nr:DUF4157 domain-containing protein [Gammaproteobacteria bacterium]
MRTFIQKSNSNQQATSTTSMLSGRAQIGQNREVDSGFHLQREVGNQLGSSVTNGFAHDFSQVPVCTKLPFGIQAKLKIGQPNDKYEQEADRVAEQVISMPDPQVATTNDGVQHKNSASSTIQRMCTECQAEEEERLQRKSFTSYTPPRISALTSPLAARFSLQHQAISEEEMGDENEDYVQAKASTTHTPTPTITPGLHTRINALKGTGQPLSPSTRAFFEPRFGRDYSQVRIHTDGRANDLASNINARAFTVGSDVVFGAGEYSSGTYSGRRLLAHELTHVVQQSGGSYVREIIAPPPFFSVSGIQGKQIGKILVQRQEVSVRSPVFEEAVTQYSTIRAATSGRPLTSTEIDLAKSVFGNSIDYNRVRFIPAESKALDWRTIGNTIREPKGYNIIKKLMHRRLFMHEMTHIWQYQHGGTKYISGSLVENSVV